MIVIHKSPLLIPQHEVKLQECSWGGFTQTFLSTIPVCKNPEVETFWDNILTKHHQQPLVTNYYELHNFPLSYKDLVWLGNCTYGDSTTEEHTLAIEFMKDYGIYITTAILANTPYVVELRLLDYRYLR